MYGGLDPFPYIERAVDDVIGDARRASKKKAFKTPLSGVAKRIYEILSDMFSAEALAPELRKRLLTTTENRSLAAFERDPDLKAILERYDEKREVEEFALELDSFFVLNQLHVETDARRNLLRTIQAEDVTLIGYEWLT